MSERVAASAESVSPRHYVTPTPLLFFYIFEISQLHRCLDSISSCLPHKWLCDNPHYLTGSRVISYRFHPILQCVCFLSPSSLSHRTPLHASVYLFHHDCSRLMTTHQELGCAPRLVWTSSSSSLRRTCIHLEIAQIETANRKVRLKEMGQFRGKKKKSFCAHMRWYFSRFRKKRAYFTKLHWKPFFRIYSWQVATAVRLSVGTGTRGREVADAARGPIVA